MESSEKITKVCDNLKNFLLEKNKRYGDSVLSPIGVFSKTQSNSLDFANQGIQRRIDDKLSRIKNSPILRKNDVVDLAGYLVLLMVNNGWDDFNELID